MDSFFKKDGCGFTNGDFTFLFGAGPPEIKCNNCEMTFLRESIKHPLDPDFPEEACPYIKTGKYKEAIKVKIKLLDHFIKNYKTILKGLEEDEKTK